MKKRKGLTLVELLVVVALIGVLLAILIPAVQKIREAASRAQSLNNIREISLATHNFASSHFNLLPNINGKANTPNPRQSIYFSLLPFLDKDSIYKQFLGKSQSAHFNLPLFLSPADPSLFGTYLNFGVTSYAANAQVFTNFPSLTATFADGTSNTITFGEHYALNCGDPNYSAPVFSWVWYEHTLGPHRPTFADGGPDVDSHANYADAYPVTSGNPPTTKGVVWTKGRTFQTAPSLTNCNMRFANTPHASGMLVGLGDGSARQISPKISEETFWGAVTPAGGEMLGSD